MPRLEPTEAAGIEQAELAEEQWEQLAVALQVAVELQVVEWAEVEVPRVAAQVAR